MHYSLSCISQQRYSEAQEVEIYGFVVKGRREYSFSTEFTPIIFEVISLRLPLTETWSIMLMSYYLGIQFMKLFSVARMIVNYAWVACPHRLVM